MTADRSRQATSPSPSPPTPIPHSKPRRLRRSQGVTAEAVDSATVLVRFPGYSPEQLYDATWHVRILPEHIWSATPPGSWASDTSIAHLVGSGPYRVTSWARGTSVTLDADSAWQPAPAIRRLVWRFTTDPDAALNLLLASEAELLEHAGPPAQSQRAAADTLLRRAPLSLRSVRLRSVQVCGCEGKAAIRASAIVRSGRR